jgi:MFS family permease
LTHGYEFPKQLKIFMSVQVLRTHESTDTIHPETSDLRVALQRPQLIVTMGCLSLAMFMIVLDTAMIPPTIPMLVKQFGNVGQIGWVGSANLLAATAFSPLFGSFCDIFGRHGSFLFALLLFGTGGLVCGFSTNMATLVAGRVIGGAGRSGIFACTLIIIADIATLRDRGLYQGIVGAFYGLASVLGPIMGGAFVDLLTWRWCFWISPILVAPVLLCFSLYIRLPVPPGHWIGKLKKLDYAGVVVLFAAVACFLIPIQAAGTIWEWHDAPNIVLLILSPVLIALFVYMETKAQNPIIPSGVFENKSVVLFLLISFLFGSGFFSINYYINSFFVVVQGTNAFDSGLLAIPLLACSILMNVISGLMVTLFGKYKYWLLVGPCLLLIGQALLCTMNETTTSWLPSLYLGIAGLGLGCLVQIRIIGLQASIRQENIAVASALSNFMMNLGGSIGIACSSAILTNRLYALLPPELAQLFIKTAPRVRVNAEAARIISAVSDSISKTYFFSMPLSVVLFVLGWFVHEYKIEKEDRSK